MLGLGEAGRLYADGLARSGAAVRGYDPFIRSENDSFTRVPDLAGALAGADVVLSLTGARVSLAVAAEALPLVPEGAVYADMNTGSPRVKAEIERLAASEGALMADVAVLAPVPRAGHLTPLAVSGGGAEKLSGILAAFGTPVEVVGARAGDAARLKLLRSMFMKGLAALVIEGLTAAESAGAEPWLRGQIAAELGPEGDALVERLVSGTRAHAERRRHEVQDALESLETDGRPADMTRATLAWFDRILAEQPPGQPPGQPPR